jgi:predicted anti-sigma-YlaC factor YlaD
VSDSCRSSVRDMLPWYLNGSLEGGEAVAVRDHLADCAECSAELDALGEIAGLVRVHGVPIAPRPRTAAFPAPVPSLPGAPRIRRRRLTFVSAVAAVLAMAAILGFFRFQALQPMPRAAADPDAGASSRDGAAVPPDIAAPPPGPGTAPPESAAAPMVVAHLDLGAGPTRGEGAIPVLSIPAGAGRVEVTFVIPGGGDRASVRIEDDARRAVSEWIPLNGHDALGHSTVVFPASAFGHAGFYDLVLSQREAGATTPGGSDPRQQYRYSFRLTGFAGPITAPQR